MRTRKTTLITDFDNTLYDWFHMWHASFSAMLTEIERISGIPRAQLLPEIRIVHQRYGTSEYAFLIEELPALRAKFPSQNLEVLFDDAIHAYRSVRKRSLRLYDGVRDTLIDLRSRGVLIIVYTESLAFYTNDRIRRLGLDDVIDFIYSPPDHELPQYITDHAQRKAYRLEHAIHRYLKPGEIKPNPVVLLDIAGGCERHADECLYVGDSLMKDIAMAQDAGVMDVFAAYGSSAAREEYKLLQQVSHWKEATVQQEMTTTIRTVRPTHTIGSFPEIAQFF